jgi:hypothetical protein
MPGVYRPRHQERTVLYWVLFHHFDRFLAEYENRFEKEYGYLRPIIKELVEKYIDCGNPKCGFARVRCQDCGSDGNGKLNSQGNGKQKSNGYGKQESHRHGKWDSHCLRTPVR